MHERCIDSCYETVRFWVVQFGLMIASENRQKRSGLQSN